MRLDKMSGGKGRHERQLSGHDRGGDDPGETSSVVAWRVRVGSGDAEHLKAGVLRGEEGSSAHGSNLDGRHGAGDEEVGAVVDAKAEEKGGKSQRKRKKHDDD